MLISWESGDEHGKMVQKIHGRRRGRKTLSNCIGSWCQRARWLLWWLPRGTCSCVHSSSACWFLSHVQQRFLKRLSAFPMPSSGSMDHGQIVISEFFQTSRNLTRGVVQFFIQFTAALSEGSKTCQYRYGWNFLRATMTARSSFLVTQYALSAFMSALLKYATTLSCPFCTWNRTAPTTRWPTGWEHRVLLATFRLALI